MGRKSEKLWVWMGVKPVICLVGLAVGLLMATGCQKKKDDNPSPPNREGVFTYSLQTDQCTTGIRTDYSLLEHCRTLQLDANNGTCPRDVRQPLFAKDCAGYEFSPEGALQSLDLPGLVSRCSITEASATARDIDEGTALRVEHVSPAKQFSFGHSGYQANVTQKVEAGSLIAVTITITKLSEGVGSVMGGVDSFSKVIKGAKPTVITKAERGEIRVVCRTVLN